jgi:hypothetical protein
MRSRRLRLSIASLAALAMLLALAAAASAQGLRWRLVQPQSPPAAAGITPPELCPGPQGTGCSQLPVELGRVGDVEFTAPNRGLLITAGNGATLQPGVWEYNGQDWHELASVCGATDGRVAWAAANEFWTVSDGRSGQAANGEGLLPPLEDDTLCHFGVSPTSGALEVLRSYAAPAFEADSYQPMLAAACLSASDCWFGGEQLPFPQPGAFALHWNGATLEASPDAAAHLIEDITAFSGRLLQSIGLPREEVEGKDELPIEILHPYVLDEIGSESGGVVFAGLRPFAPGHVALPEYASGSYPAALGALRLSTDMEGDGEEALWAAAGPAAEPPNGSASGALTVLRDAGGKWSQVLGPPGSIALGSDPADLEEDVVTALAGEPGSASAWLGLDTQLDVREPSALALATVAHVHSDGTVSEERLPSSQELAEGVPPAGGTAALACPAANDCWLATTQGALFHLSEEGEQTLALDGDPAFAGPVITSRPPDEGLPQAQSVAVPSANPGEEEQAPAPRSYHPPALEGYRLAVAPYSDAHSRLRGMTLELSFRLPVEARARLLAKRDARVVASTPQRVMQAGRHTLRLRLNRRRWPTGLDLRVEPLAPLPTVSASRSVNTLVTNSLKSSLGRSLPQTGLAWRGLGS